MGIHTIFGNKKGKIHEAKNFHTTNKILSNSKHIYKFQNSTSMSETVERPQWLHYGLHALQVEGLAERAIPPLGYHDPPCRHSVVPI